jgi:hypothetical protein
MELTLVHKGKSAATTATTSDELFAAAAAAFDLPPAQHALSTSTMSWERVAVQNLPPHPAAGNCSQAPTFQRSASSRAPS